MNNFATLAEAFSAQAERLGERVFLKDKTGKAWRDHSWSDINDEAGRLRAGLLGLGLERGDRIAILSDSCPRWVVVDQAALGMGAEGDLLPYFVSRYFGIRSFGQVYGYLFAIFMIGVGVGPSLMGFSFDRWHSYGPMFVMFEFALFFACVIFLRLGPYRFPPNESMGTGDENETLPSSASALGSVARP